MICGNSCFLCAVNDEGYRNPWVTACSQIMDKKIKELSKEPLPQTLDYMVFENLTSKFQFPSVLDLKMGTRQHGDDIPPEKVERNKHTCTISTAKSLGVRMAGMQVMLLWSV